MTKWELSTYPSGELYNVTGSVAVERLWKDKDKKTGLSDWDEIIRRARDGWELVSVTPLAWNGTVQRLLYTFKRPIEEGQ